MTGIARRLRKLETLLSPRVKGPSYADLLRAALERARERARLGLPRDDAIPPESDNPWAQRYRQALIRVQASPRMPVTTRPCSPWTLPSQSMRLVLSLLPS